MNRIIRNILAVIAGWLLGSVINLSLIKIGHSVFPIEGIDPGDMEALAEVMPTLDFKYFIFPFLAHALGTLIGAFIAGLIVQVNIINYSFRLNLYPFSYNGART
jgi:hypothetical protein